MRAEARSPRVRMLADGAEVPGVIGADVFANNHLHGDRFRVRLAAASGGLDVVDRADVRLEVQVGDEAGWQSLVVGEADSVALDPIRGCVDVEGRDLSSLLIDAQVDETFSNQTSSEIVEVLAGRHGLSVMAVRTTTLVGRYYQSDHGRLAMGQFSKALTQWDLLAFLAGQEGFDLFMDGATLRFQPQSRDAVISVRPEDCIAIHLEHSLGMSRSIEVTVRSWDQRGAEAVVQTAKGGGASGRGRGVRHAVVRPNLPPDEAQRLAERVVADMVRHEWTASLSMPGETEITPRHAVSLEGTGTGWDRVFGVGEVVRSIDVRRGFTQRVRLQGMG